MKVTQETGYPKTETSTLTLDMKQAQRFGLKFRVPGWSRDMSVKVNGAAANVACKPGEWAVIERTWNPDDRVEVRIPLTLRMVPVHKWHPNRVAIVRGPVVLVLDFNYHDPNFELPSTDEALNKWLVPDGSPVVFRVERPDGHPVRLRFRPFYDQPIYFPYLLYFDLKSWPYALW